MLPIQSCFQKMKYAFLNNLIWAIELKKVIFWWDYFFNYEDSKKDRGGNDRLRPHLWIF